MSYYGSSPNQTAFYGSSPGQTYAQPTQYYPAQPTHQQPVAPQQNGALVLYPQTQPQPIPGQRPQAYPQQQAYYPAQPQPHQQYAQQQQLTPAFAHSHSYTQHPHPPYERRGSHASHHSHHSTHSHASKRSRKSRYEDDEDLDHRPSLGESLYRAWDSFWGLLDPKRK